MVVDLFLVYQFIRRLATPFNKWAAYEAGVIDDQGNVLIKKKDRDSKQKKAFGVFDVMVRNMKKLLAKVPGGSTRLASYAAALYLIKEHNAFTEDSLITEDTDEDELEKSLSLFSEAYLNYTTLDDRVNGFLSEKLKNEVLEEAAAPRWKRSGNNGEIQATVGGKKYQIEKALDHNERHKGEWKVMVWDKRRDSWEWETTEYGKANAKDWIMDKLKEEAIDEDGPCWDTHKQVGMKKKGNKLVPNCVPKIEEAPVNNVGDGNIAGMDGGHMSKAAQKKWTSGNKTKKKKLRDMIGDKL